MKLENEIKRQHQSELNQLELSKKLIIEEMLGLASEQEKSKLAMQAELSRLDNKYQENLLKQEIKSKSIVEENEKKSKILLENEKLRVTNEITSKFEKEHLRLIEIQKQSQIALEREREEMRNNIKQMEKDKNILQKHMKQTEEKAQEELVLAELMKSEYLDNMNNMNKKQKSLQLKMEELDRKKIQNQQKLYMDDALSN